MKKYILFSGILFLAFCFGCQKNKEVKELLPKEEINITAQPIPTQSSSLEKTGIEENITQSQPQSQETEPQPSAENIQRALKNANLYNGEIDGKIGPKTIEAIKKFQQENNLKVDGKVGPKTWAVLKKYLNLSVPSGVNPSEIKD